MSQWNATCHQTGVALKTSSGCGTVKYCGAACQTAAWVDHRVACKRARKVLEKAKEATKAPGSDSGLGDMGSIMAAPNMRPQKPQQRYNGWDVYNACYYDRHEELKKLLLQPGMDIDWARSDTGGTAGHVAAQEGHEKCLAQLISKGATLLKVDDKSRAPIHMACHFGRYTTLALLLDNGVDANLRTSDELGMTPVIVSCGMGHVKLLALLLDRGADPNLARERGDTAAHIVCQGGHVKCLQLLIKRGAKINPRDVNGITPLDYARAYKHRECEDLLLLNQAVGMVVGVLRPLPEVDKVCMAASFRLCLSPSNTYLLVLFHCLVFYFLSLCSLLRKSPPSLKLRRQIRRAPDDATTRRAKRVPMAKASPRSVRLVISRCTAAPRAKLRTGPSTRCCAKS
jgi:hypothetical protein